MQIESDVTSQRILAEFWNFADALRNSGKSIEDCFLGAFTAILASREAEHLEFSYSKANDFNIISHTVDDFLKKLFPTEISKIHDILNIDFEHPALHRLLYFCNNSTLSNSDLIETLD